MPLQIDNLPDAALVSIATYLSKTSRLLLSAALTAPASSWEKYDYKIEPPEASKIIASAKSSQGDESKDILSIHPITDHFIEKRLTDADVGAILVCADAVNTVKSLGCAITSMSLEKDWNLYVVHQYWRVLCYKIAQLPMKQDAHYCQLFPKCMLLPSSTVSFKRETTPSNFCGYQENGSEEGVKWLRNSW